MLKLGACRLFILHSICNTMSGICNHNSLIININTSGFNNDEKAVEKCIVVACVRSKYDITFCLLEVRAMVVAVQQPSAECTAIFTVCIV